MTSRPRNLAVGAAALIAGLVVLFLTLSVDWLILAAIGGAAGFLVGLLVRKTSPAQTAVIVIVIGAVAIVGMVALLVHKTSKNPTATDSSHETSQSTTDTPALQRLSGVNLNREARDGKLAFVVTAVDTSKVTSEPNHQSTPMTSKGTYVNVHMTVKNTDDRPRTFWADNQRLWIQGQPFFPDSTAAHSTGAAKVKINPGNSATVVVSFDIPDGTTTAVDAVELHDTAMSAGVTVIPRP
ncbi:MAG TPA: DUF4352 domain-containing protein [Mycobacterium sp.]|nr:DUF4352 domain-containing protein [Mycobacterium sp.]